jgi:cysteine dioxygenase
MRVTNMGITRLVDYLESLRGRAPLQELLARMQEIDVNLGDVQRFVRFAERTYRRNLVQSGPSYNLWVMCWRNGQRSHIHDHKGSSCGMRVLQGTLTETLFAFAPNGHIFPTGSREFQPGQVLGGQDADVHQVSNLQAGKADLVTLHVYSPPLLMMGTYSLTDNLRGEEPMLLDFADAAGI